MARIFDYAWLKNNDSKCLTPLYIGYEIYVLILKYFLSSLSNLGSIMSKFLLAPTIPSIDMEARGFRRSKSIKVVTPDSPKMQRCMISSFIWYIYAIILPETVKKNQLPKVTFTPFSACLAPYLSNSLWGILAVYSWFKQYCKYVNHLPLSIYVKIRWRYIYTA